MADLDRRHRLRKRLRAPRSRLLLIGLAAVAIVFLVGSAIVAQLSRDAAQTETSIVEDQRDATAAQAVEASKPVLDLCGDESPVGEALREDPRNPCGLAQQVQAAPVPGPEGPRGADGPAPTAEQISGAVAAYLVDNPAPAGRAPTPAEVAAAVAAYLTEHPPSPGRAPTAGEIASAVGTYYAANPPPAGRDGEPGPAPTPEEIRAAVAEYMAANPPPAGRDGVDGSEGPPGRDGSPAASYTMTFPDRSTQTCERSGGLDTAPAYECGPPVPPPPISPLIGG